MAGVEKIRFIVFGFIFGRSAWIYLMFDGIRFSDYDNTWLYHLVFAYDITVSIVSTQTFKSALNHIKFLFYRTVVKSLLDKI